MLSPNRHIHSVVNQDGAALLDADRGMISTLNRTAAFVWERLERGEDVETIIAALACATDEDVTRIEPQVREFLADLENRGLLS